MLDVFGYSTNPEVAKRQLEEDYEEDNAMSNQEEDTERRTKMTQKDIGMSWSTIYSKIQLLEEENKFLKQEVEDYREIAEDLNESNNVYDEQVQKMKRENQELENDIAELEKRYEETVKENLDLKEQIVNLTHFIIDMNMKNNGISHELKVNVIK